MRIGLHVGLTTVDVDVLSVLVDNRQRLAEHGCAVAPEEHDFLPPGEEPSDLLRLVAQTTANWSSWLPSVATGSTVMSCVHLGDALLAGGQAKELVALLEGYGEVSGGVLVRRIDDYVATRYVQDLFAGRTSRLSDRELAGAGPNNYLARIAKWQSACGPEFRAVMCPSAGSDGDSVLQLLHALGIPDSVQLDLPSPRGLKSIGPVEAEVIRRFNRLLKHSGFDESRADSVRGAVIARLSATPSERPFAIPADAARYLLSTFEARAETLSRSMTPDQASAFLSLDHPPDAAVDDSEVDERVDSLAREFEVSVDSGKSRSAEDQALVDIRRLVRRARTKRVQQDTEQYLRCVKKVRRRIPVLSDFRRHGVGQGVTATIPDRVLQYWDPSPPPDEMLPWLESWATVGMPHGTHEVADFERGLGAVEEAAGDLGRRAFEASTHPAVRSDLFRYAELFLRGGWYVDAEHEALVPLRDFLPWKVEHILVVRPHTDRFPNGFIGAVAGSPLMQEALHQACRRVLEGVERSVLDISGPRMFRPLVHEYLRSPTASFVVVPTNAVFADVLQRVHNEAEYKAHGHWRHADT